MSVDEKDRITNREREREGEKLETERERNKTITRRCCT